MKKPFTIKAKVWLYPGDAAWHFVSLSKATSTKIKQRFGAQARGWGSLPVTVKLGESEWETSIFPESKEGCYLLPLKAQIRKREAVFAGDTITFSLTIRV